MRRTVLPNGLRVVTEEVPSAATFSVGVFAGVGSRHESAARHGASHFLEHVLFKGTRRRSAEEISAAIEAVGGDLNAYTTKEHTCFYARVLRADAGLAVDVLADLVTSSRVTRADVDAERAVIADEIAMHGDDPSDVIADLVHATLFPGRGLGPAVIGSPESIEAMSRDQVVRHWRQHYAPGNLVVAAAGAVDHDELLGKLGPLVDLPAAPAPAPSPTTHPRSDGGLVTVERRLEQVTASLAFPGVGVFDDRRYALGLLSLVLGGGMASRLFVEVRERRGLTYGIDAGETTYSDAGTWTVDWQCAPRRLPEITQLVRAILDDVAEHGVTAAELERAKGQMRGQTVLSYESASSRMSRLGANTLLGDERTLDEVVAGFDAVSGEDVRAEAARLFAGRGLLALVGPRVPSTGLAL